MGVIRGEDRARPLPPADDVEQVVQGLFTARGAGHAWKRLFAVGRQLPPPVSKRPPSSVLSYSRLLPALAASAVTVNR